MTVLHVQGCSLIKSGIAYYEPTDSFVTHKNDSRVLYEKGGEKLSNIVALQMQSSVSKVESIHNEIFSKQIRVYVCATYESFEKHTAKKNPRGVMIGDRIFLSPKLLEKPDTIKNILTHELSHLHFAQRIGKTNYFYNIPAWFQEGLATYVSEGGGSENVSEHDAIKALKTQHFFTPEGNGSLFFIKNASSYGFYEYYKDPAIAQHMFYQQSEMFIAYLRKKNVAKFNGLIASLLAGEKFETAFKNNYNKSVSKVWGMFVNDLQT